MPQLTLSGSWGLGWGGWGGRRGCVRDSHVTQTEATLRDAARGMLGEHRAQAGHHADRLGSTSTPS